MDLIRSSRKSDPDQEKREFTPQTHRRVILVFVIPDFHQ
jgi:hypothetical protein